MTLFLPNHERHLPPNSSQITSTVYEYTLQASQTYLQKFDQPYNAFESDLTIHRRIIPVEEQNFELLSQAVQRADSLQAETEAVEENSTTITFLPIDSNKGKVLDVSNNNTPSKRIKSSVGKGDEIYYG